MQYKVNHQALIGNQFHSKHKIWVLWRKNFLSQMEISYIRMY